MSKIPRAIINGCKFKARKLKLSELGALVLCALVSTGLSTLLLGCKNCKSEEDISQAQCPCPARFAGKIQWCDEAKATSTACTGSYA